MTNGISFTTSGDGKPHYLSEKLGTALVYPPHWRVVIRNEAYSTSGADMISGSGPLGVGFGKSVTAVLLTPTATYVDSITVWHTRLEEIVWNDFGKVCQVSVVWNEDGEGSHARVL